MTTESWRAAADALVHDLQRVFGSRLRSVVAYGPHIDGVAEAPLTCLALVQRLDVADLEACAQVSPEWHRRRLATPLVIPEDEFRRSLDAFPLEFGEILRTHAHVFGHDPFDSVRIAQEDLRRACETQVKSHLLHLREEFMEAGNRPAQVAAVVAESAPAFAALLRNIARLNGGATTNRAEATLEGARMASLDEGVVRNVLALEQPGSLPTTDAARLFPQYLQAVEQLARAVDTWRA